MLKGMKKIVLLLLFLLGGCSSNTLRDVVVKYDIHTQREKPYYLSTDAQQVRDTCPGNDILKSYTCTEKEEPDFTCFDVYMVQGSPVPEQRYTLLQETVELQHVTPQPQCPQEVTNCETFLKALNYNLEFSWYLVNFPSSSFSQCRETYDCKRIDCYRPVTTQAPPASTLISCVYKKNQLFFVGSDITCQKVLR